MIAVQKTRAIKNIAIAPSQSGSDASSNRVIGSRKVKLCMFTEELSSHPVISSPRLFLSWEAPDVDFFTVCQPAITAGLARPLILGFKGSSRACGGSHILLPEVGNP